MAIRFSKQYLTIAETSLVDLGLSTRDVLPLYFDLFIRRDRGVYQNANASASSYKMTCIQSSLNGCSSSWPTAFTLDEPSTVVRRDDGDDKIDEKASMCFGSSLENEGFLSGSCDAHRLIGIRAAVLYTCCSSLKQKTGFIAVDDQDGKQVCTSVYTVRYPPFASTISCRLGAQGRSLQKSKYKSQPALSCRAS